MSRVDRIDAVRRRVTEPLARTSLLAILTTIVTSLLGYLYWIATARIASSQTVGLTAGSLSLVTGVALATNLGIVGYVMQNLPRLENTPLWQETLARALWPTVLLSGLATLVVQTGVVLTLNRVGHELISVPLAVVAAMALTISNVLEGVMIATRKASLATLLGALLGTAKLASIGVAALVGASPKVLLATWTASLVFSIGVTFWLIFPRLGQGPPVWNPRLRLSSRDLLNVMGHHMTSLGGLMVPYLLPTLVIARLGAEAGGYFYTTWMMGSVFFMISPAVANSLFTEGARDQSQLAHSSRRALGLLVVLLPVPILIGVTWNRWLLSLFGQEYADHGATLLMILALAAIPDAISNIGVAIWRSRGQLGRSAPLNVAMGVLSLLGAWLLMPRCGIEGAGWAWLIAQGLGMLAVAPLVARLCLTRG